MDFYNRYHNKHTINTKWDMLEHYMCFSEYERQTNRSSIFFTDVIEEIDNSDSSIRVPECARKYAKELGIEHRVVGEKPTLWKKYSHICQLINATHDDTQHPRRRSMRTLLMSILDAPSTEIADVQKIYCDLNEYVQMLIHNNYRGEEDFYREMFNIIFADLLPFKYHAYDLSLILDKGFIKLEPTSLSSECYLEMLFQMFFYSMQSLRGKSLSDYRSILDDVSVYIYLIISTIFPERSLLSSYLDNRDILCLFRVYLDLEIPGKVGNHVISKVENIFNDSADWFTITKHLSNTYHMTDHLISKENHRRLDELKAQWYVDALDIDFSNTTFIGDPYYQTERFQNDGLKFLLYAIEQVQYPLIRLYLKMIKEESCSFDIDENRMGYLRSLKIGDMGKVLTYDRQSDHVPETLLSSKTIIHIPKEDEIFVLFTVKESDDLFGIGLQEYGDGTRKLLRFETSKNKYTYSLILGGDKK